VATFNSSTPHYLQRHERPDQAHPRLPVKAFLHKYGPSRRTALRTAVEQAEALSAP